MENKQPRNKAAEAPEVKAEAPEVKDDATDQPDNTGVYKLLTPDGREYATSNLVEAEHLQRAHGYKRA